MAIPKNDLDGIASEAYDLTDPDAVYECAYDVARRLERRGLAHYKRDYPFNTSREDTKVRAAWDMGYEDGVGDEQMSPEGLFKYVQSNVIGIPGKGGLA